MDKKEVEKYIIKTLPSVAFYWYQTYGFPIEMFQEELKKINLLQQFIMCKKYGRMEM